MKKIIMSLMAIGLTVGVVSSAAYALFSDTATVNGITLSTGNADLLVSDGTGGFVQSVDLSAFDAALANLYPSLDDWTYLPIKNASQSHIAMTVTGKLTTFPAGADWEALKNVIYIKVTGGGVDTGWKTLQQWASAEIPLTNAAGIAHNTEMQLRVDFLVDQNATNSIANKQLTNMAFTLTGTQIAEVD